MTNVLDIFQGFLSSIAEIEHVEPQSYLSSMMQEGRTGPWLIIVAVLLGIILSALALLLMQRRRRSQNSFSRFANSHYDTKTGATRLGVEDLDDHNDVTRFPDDEPLVIT